MNTTTEPTDRAADSLSAVRSLVKEFSAEHAARQMVPTSDVQNFLLDLYLLIGEDN